MLLTLLKFAIAIACAVGGTMAGTRWIAKLYADADYSLLSAPSRVFQQNQKRGMYLSAALGFLFCFAALRSASFLAFLSAAMLIYFCVLFTATDLEQRVIFDRMMIPFAVLGLVFTLLGSGSLVNHLIAMVVFGVVFLGLAVITKGAIGGGDIKLLAALGLWTGTQHTFYIAIGGILLGGLAALFLVLTHKKNRKDFFPYGPGFTICAMILCLLS